MSSKRLLRLKTAIVATREEIKTRVAFVNRHGWSVDTDDVLISLRHALEHFERRKSAKSIYAPRVKKDGAA